MMEFERPDGLRQQIHVEPAYDKRGEGYGIGSAIIAFVVSGPAGAVALEVMTGWHTTSIREERDADPYDNPPLPSLTIHSRAKRADHNYYTEDCSLVPGGCYSDIGMTWGETIFGVLTDGGLEELWRELVVVYRNELVSEPEPCEPKS